MDEKVTTLILNIFCPSFQLVQESCTSGTDRGVSDACIALPLVREWMGRGFTENQDSSALVLFEILPKLNDGLCYTYDFNINCVLSYSILQLIAFIHLLYYRYH